MKYVKKSCMASAAVFLVLLIVLGAITLYSFMFEFFFAAKQNTIREICAETIQQSALISAADSFED